MIYKSLETCQPNSKTVLDQLLDEWGINYKTFAKEVLGVSYETLRQYRRGELRLNLNTSQIRRLETKLHETGRTFQSLPDDWILDTCTEVI